MKLKSNPFLRTLALTSSIVLSFAASAFAATYQWNGSKDSVWTDTANWNAGAVPVSGSHRININNGTSAAPANEAIYNLGTTLTVGSNSDRGLVIGSPAGSNGSLRITSGTISTANNTTSTTAADIIGNGNGSTAVLTIDGGNFVGGASPMSMGFGGGPTCTLTLTTNGGSFTAASLAFNNTTGTVNLDGGTLAVNTFTRSGGTNTINLNGGTLKPRITSATFIGNLSSTTVRVKSGGAKIDTSGDATTGVNATIALPLREDPASTGGGLTKNGPGTLTLTGVHTFTGGIAINEGTLALNPTAPYTYNGNITGTGALGIGGTGPVLLGGSIIPNINVASGTSFGGEGSTSGSLTLSGTNTFYFNSSTTGPSEHFRAASIDATGATVSFLTFGGSGAATGVVVMESTSSNIVGDIGTEFIGNSRIELSFNNTENPTQLLADYTPGALVWKGTDATNPTFWDIDTTVNWFNNTTSSDDTFIAGDTVLFDDTAATGAVAIQGSSVQPSSVTFSNDTLEYTLSGSAISGAGTLTVSGPGTVNLNAANSYSGGTTLNGGVVNAPISNALGGGAVAVNTGAILNLTSTSSGDFGYFGISSGAATLTGGGIINVSLGNGNATRQFNGNNSGFTGTMNIGISAAAGAGKAQIQGSLGAATVNVLQNATVYVASPTANHPAAITLNGGDTGESVGQLRLDAGSTWSGTVTLAGDITGTGDGFIGSSGGTNTISGAINESGGAKALSKVGGGKIISTVANGYTGATNILGGTLTIQNVGGLSGAGTTVANNASLELDGGLDMPTESLNLTGGGAGAGGALRSASGNNIWNGTITTAGLCRIDAVADLLTLDGNITLPAPGSSQIVLQGAGNIDVNGTISDNAGGAGTLSSSANGDGIRTLHAANDYTGPTNINGGKLVITNALALGTTAGGTAIAGEGFGGGSLVLPGGITVDGEAVVLGGRKDATADNPHLINQSGNNTWTGDMSFTTGGLEYNIESQAGLLTLSGQISGGGIGSTRNLKLMGDGNGEVSGAIINGTGTTFVQITKRGGGTWTLSGTNLYSGNTGIEDGTIALASTGQMRFVPATNGLNNAISGTGTFDADGSFLIDLAGADTTDGNSWLLVDDSSLTSLTYGTNFSVTSSAGVLTESSPGVWEITDSGKTWAFDESTGALTVVDAAGGGYSTWADDNAGGQTADLDFDKDGVSNGVEYFMGETGTSFTTSPASFANKKATWTNGGNIPAADYGTQFWIQTSTNLVNWTDVLSTDPNLENLSGSASYTLTGSGKEFMRLKVTPN